MTVRDCVPIRGCQVNHCADRVPVGFSADEPHPHRMYSWRDVVPVQTRRALIGRDQQIQVAVAVEVAISQAASHFGRGEATAGQGSHVPKDASPAVQKEVGRLGITGVAANLSDGLVNVTVDGHQVEPAVQIDVQEGAPEAQAVARSLAHAGADCAIGVDSGTGRAVERHHFVVEVGDGDPFHPELSKSAVSIPIPARALPSSLNATPARTATSSKVPLRILR